MDDLAALATEASNPASDRLDELSTHELLAVINREDQTVAAAVERELTQIAAAVDAIVERFRLGGRLFYIGAGTSGRLGVLDASECPPTFSTSSDLFQGIIAGGDGALRRSSEQAEDSQEQGAADLAALGFGVAPDGGKAPDTLVGIAASGRTPYVLGAMDYARSLGCLTVALTCVPSSAIARAATFAITPATGPEVLTGSTRMKAGTATKMVLNMLSTAVMVRAGAVYGNLMVNVRPTNAKLLDRAQRIVMAVTHCDQATAARLLEVAGEVKTAIVMQVLGLEKVQAEERLRRVHGVLRTALE